MVAWVMDDTYCWWRSNIRVVQGFDATLFAREDIVHGVVVRHVNVVARVVKLMMNSMLRKL